MKILVSEDRTVLVTVFEEDGQEVVTVATRPEPDAVWGPPVRVVRERS